MKYDLDVKRIKTEMRLQDLSQADICRALGTDPSNLSRLLRRGTAYTDTVAQLSGALRVSPGDIVPALRTPRKTLGQLLSAAVIRSHKSLLEIAELADIPVRALHKWETDESYPNLLDACSVADVLGLSLDSLTGRAVQ
jgi:transcriptional regulator with XRE-family HTH domain